MRKLLVLTAICMMIPAMAFAGMTTVNDDVMADVRGQAGIGINASINITQVLMGIDTDGGNYIVQNISSTGAVVIDGLSIKTGVVAGTTGNGNSAILIGLPDITCSLAIAMGLDTSVAAPAGATLLMTQTLDTVTLGASTVEIYAIP